MAGDLFHNTDAICSNLVDAVVLLPLPCLLCLNRRLFQDSDTEVKSANKENVKLLLFQTQHYNHLGK